MKTNGRVYGLVNIVCAMNHDSSLRSMATRDFQKMITVSYRFASIIALTSDKHVSRAF